MELDIFGSLGSILDDNDQVQADQVSKLENSNKITKLKIIGNWDGAKGNFWRSVLVIVYLANVGDDQEELFKLL